jgi:hypothetical protein
MEKNLYIDASHPNETRIVLKSNSSIEEYEFEDKNRLNFKNNISYIFDNRYFYNFLIYTIFLKKFFIFCL